jgi:DNA-binding winged helix-turn-helix (wHTH) protein
LLVDHCGQLVTREEILEHICGKGVFIDSENAINTAVRKIRRALNDDAESSPFIVTIPGKGYRFVEPVRIPNGEATTNGHGEEAIIRQSALTSASDESQSRRHNHWLALISVAGRALVAAAMAVVAHLSRGTSTTFGIKHFGRASGTAVTQ